MNAFVQASLVEQQALDALMPIIRQRSEDGRFVLIQRGPRAQELQRTVGDFILTREDKSEVCTVELKAEQKYYKNLFLESWSNLSRLTRGWMHSLQSEVLWYYRLATKHLYVADVATLKQWAFTTQPQEAVWLRGRVHDFPERRQAEYEQYNDTWGWCVPIGVLAKEAGLRGFVLTPDAELGVRLVSHSIPCTCGSEAPMPSTNGHAHTPALVAVAAASYTREVPF
jgi:hypothetical protein